MMTSSQPMRHQDGAVLIVGMIMLVLITLMVTTAYTLSSSNAKAVANMQFRSEAIASANRAIEQVVGAWTFDNVFPANTIQVDIDNNNTFDYEVAIAAPVCVSAGAITAVNDPGGGEVHTNLAGITTKPQTIVAANFNVTWDIDATVTSAATGTRTRIRQGLSKTIDQAKCDAVCPPAPGTPCT